MSRRRKTSPAEDLLTIVSMLPWWVGVALALVAYVLLHRVAGQVLPMVNQPGQLGSAVAQSVWIGLAGVGQYIVPLICFGGAGVSAWRRRERRNLVADVAQSKAADALDTMSWAQFERLVGEAFRLQGYRVAEVGAAGPDGGIDLVLTKDSEKFLVQCKQWKALRVGVEVIRELYGVMAAKGATGGFVVTSGRFTQEAIGFADGRNVRLLDGPKLHVLIRQAKESKGSTHPAPASTTDRPHRDPPVPTCPVCSNAMVKRTAMRGPNSGEAFWGCVGFPSCRGTRSLAET